jgi:hypothetical protein
MWKVKKAVQEQDRLYERLSSPSLPSFLKNKPSYRQSLVRRALCSSYLTTCILLSYINHPPNLFQALTRRTAFQRVTRRRLLHLRFQDDTQVDQPGHIPIVLDLTGPVDTTDTLMLQDTLPLLKLQQARENTINCRGLASFYLLGWANSG